MGITDTSTTAAMRRFPATTSSVSQARRFLLAQLPGAERRRGGRARAHAVGAGDQCRAARRDRVRGAGAGGTRRPPCAGRGHRRRQRVPHAAGPGRRRTARARPAHCAHAGRCVGHRDAARPARQDRVVLLAAGRRGRWCPDDGARAARLGRGYAGSRDSRGDAGGWARGGCGDSWSRGRGAGEPVRLARPRGPGRTRRAARRGRGHRRPGRDPLRQHRGRGSPGLAARRAGRPAGLRHRARFTDRHGRRGLRRLRAHPGRSPRRAHRWTPTSSGPTAQTSAPSWSSASSTTRWPVRWSWASCAPATTRSCSAGRS